MSGLKASKWASVPDKPVTAVEKEIKSPRKQAPRRKKSEDKIEELSEDAKAFASRLGVVEKERPQKKEKYEKHEKHEKQNISPNHSSNGSNGSALNYELVKENSHLKKEVKALKSENEELKLTVKALKTEKALLQMENKEFDWSITEDDF